MPVPELMNAVAVEIEDPAALHVDEDSAFRTVDHIEAGRRKRLADKIALVLIEQVSGLDA